MNKIEIDKQLAKMDKATALDLKKHFQPYLDELNKYGEKAMAIKVTSVNQVDDMLKAREMRLQLKKLRVAVEKTRKDEKAESLRKGQMVDSIGNLVKDQIKPLEQYLQLQEDFIKIKEEKRKAKLEGKRLKELDKYNMENDDLSELYDLANMTNEVYASVLKQYKNNFEWAEKEAKQAETDRIAKEKAEADERAAVATENERLKVEFKKREAAMAAERKRNEKKLEAERKKLNDEKIAREKAEAELQAKEDAEAKEKADATAREKALALGPDKEKLERLAQKLAVFELPTLKEEAAKNIALEVSRQLDGICAYIRQEVIGL